MKRTTTRTTGPSLALRDLTDAQGAPVVFVTNAVRRRGGLRTRGQQQRPVLAVVVD